MPRPKGSQNRRTANAREAIGRFIDGNAHRVQGWLDKIEASDGPLMALRCYQDFVEYHVPKLQRTELTGAQGGAIQIVATHADETL